MSDGFGCDRCGAEGAPLLEAKGDESLCLKCVEAAPDLAGVDPEAVEMLTFLTKVAATSDPTGN